MCFGFSWYLECVNLLKAQANPGIYKKCSFRIYSIYIYPFEKGIL